MAKTQRQGGQYRKMLLEHQGQRTEEEEPVSFFRIRFFFCLCLFIGYLILDYTDTSFYSVDSSRICTEKIKNMTENLDLKENFIHKVNYIKKKIYM